MANKIQIKRGPSAPGANNLDTGELGYDTTSKKLYIGNIDENGNAVAPTLVNSVESVNGETGVVVLDASDVGARPNTWTPTASDVGARPNTWTPTASDVGARPNTWTPTASDVGAAPTGYGLGAISYNVALTTNANDAFRNGWYLINGDTTNGVGYAATLRVEGYSSAYVVQTAYRHTSSKIITWRRYCLNGTWTEWEDITPVAGSGLGVLPLYIDDLNTCLKNGWYAFSDGCANRPEGLSRGSVLVVNRDAKRTTQVLFGINIDGNPQMIRYTTDSGVTWIEDWVNPRMLVNTEYRTTERLHGKAVYKKADANGNVSYRLDGETVWYPEKMGMKLLWSNQTPTNTFNKQTVSLDLSKYQIVAIEYRFNTTDDYRKTYFGKVGTTMALDVVSTSGYLGWRSAEVSTTGIYFSAATYNGNSNVVSYIIPVAIYGIKGVV